MNGPRPGSNERFRSCGSRRSDLGRGSASPSSFLLVSFLASCAILLLAGAVQAAEIIDVRVGQHPTFTRVVFELDAAAGYQLSKSMSDGNEELIVTLQATSIPRRVQSPRQSLLGLVRVAPDGRQSIARIELGKKGLIVKERIMSSPYRVVLDVQDPNATVAKPKPVAKPTPKPTPKPAPKPAPAPTPKPAAQPAPKPAPKPAPPPPAPKPAPRPPDAAADDDLFGADEDVEVIEVEEDDLGPGPGADDRTPPRTPDSATAEPSEGQIATMGEKERLNRPPEVVVPKAQMADEDGGMGTLLMFVGVVALLGVGAFAVLKLRGRGRGDDDAEDDAGHDDDDDDRDGANPFARMAVHEAAAGVGRPARPAASDADTQLSLDSLVDDMPAEVPTAEPDLAKTTVTARDAGGQDEPFALTQEDDGPTPGAVASPPAAQAADDDEEIGDEEMAKLIQQFEQRIAALESRVDEQAEARERLERQVAAQTEELRVQRAAIARTQRAVRNLTRGEEDGPTEPALRDPNG